MRIASRLAAVVLAVVVGRGSAEIAPSPDVRLADAFTQEVDRRIELPLPELSVYDALLSRALADAGIARLTPQPVLLVDRNPKSQVLLLLWTGEDGGSRILGVVPVSTGIPGGYEHFTTPLGVFRHLPGNPDFRAEGTRNENGILGYGPRGARVYDFGWQVAQRTWDAGAASLMRLQLHATDPDLLEPHLGRPRSKGCIRIPLSFNRFLDRYGVLDADYHEARALGMRFWLWDSMPVPLVTPGRYLVVVDSARDLPPPWMP